MTASRRFETAVARIAALFALLAAALPAAHAQAPATAAPPPADSMAGCPMHAQHMAAAAAAKSGTGAHDHLGEVNSRGEVGMGFSQSATTHHFLLTADGGEIRVEANAADDTASRDQIRNHLVAVARSFAAGDFRTPAFIHAQVPPGVPAMERLGTAVEYSYADLDRGGRVRLHATGADALAAVHAFLRFQIEEHRTGDPLEPAS